MNESVDGSVSVSLNVPVSINQFGYPILLTKENQREQSLNRRLNVLFLSSFCCHCNVWRWLLGATVVCPCMLCH